MPNHKQQILFSFLAADTDSKVHAFKPGWDYK